MSFGMRSCGGLFSASQHANAENWLRRDINWIVLMADRGGADAMKGSVNGNLKQIPADMRPRLNVVMTVPLGFGRGFNAKTPAGRTKIKANLDAVSAGTYDADYRRVFGQLATAGLKSVVIRLGHEANGAWYPWSAVGNVGPYIEAFRHVAGIAKQEAPRALIEYNMAVSNMLTVGFDAYPGKDVVNIVGLDIYNKPQGQTTYAERWNGKLKPALERHLQYATTWQKPVSFAEWNNQKEDCAKFINDMAAWFDSLGKKLKYQSLFNPPRTEYRIPSGLYPQATKAYLKHYRL